MRRRLATPGPTEVPQRLLLAGAKEIVHHRAPEMERINTDIARRLPTLFKTEGAVYTIAASGTGAMEASVANCFAEGDEVLVVSNGYFGERFADIARAYGLVVHTVTAPWGSSVSVDAVASAYREHRSIRGVLVVYSETSAGTVNDVQAIASLFRETDVLVIVDAISGLLVHPLEMDAWGLDVVLAASHKGFMLPPGLAFIAVSDKAHTAADRGSGRAYYWSFDRLRRFHPMSSSSPAVSLLYGLQESLEIIDSEGLPVVQRRHARVARGVREALRALGFSLKVQAPDVPSNVITIAEPPEPTEAPQLIKVLSEEYGVTVTGGQADWKGEVVRFGHIGSVDEVECYSIIGAVELALASVGHPVEPGAGVGALTRSFTREEN
ncbi:alanine--glyoxylate aminotransferase family protein [Nocardiopsis rhodophaea]|uniref:pyridoxal-phosphate-dependent aminotransferase family protein n=1 Tax=Nocardiopsis rhodophaea TaxID=280238 RepID=UPI0031D85F25